MAYLYDLTDTWNAAGTVFNAIKMNVTNSASAAGSKIVSLQVGSTDRFTVDKDGNGYFSGTLQAVGAISFPNAYLSGNSGTIGMQDNSASILAYNATGSGGITNALRFITGASERMRITSSGNVGIGTSSPTQKLTVSGGSVNADNFYIQTQGASQAGTVGFANADGPGIQFWGSSTGNAGSLTFNTVSTERMRITSSGNVGIGTSSPATKLNVIGDIQLSRSATASDAAINFGSNANNYIYGGNSSNLMAFAINGSERMRINSSGNVGIGTTSPGATLTVVTNTTSHNGMRVTNNSTTQFAGSGLQMLGPSAAGSQGGATVYYYNTNAGGTNGALGIAQVDYTGNFQRNLAYYDYSGQYWGFLTNSTERLRIDSSGNLLVGTTSAGLVNSHNYNYTVGSGRGYYNHVTGTGSGADYLIFGYATGQIGSITQNGTTGVLYNITSDARLKHDIVDAPEASSLIDAIKVRSFKWNADNSEQRYGMVAQELLEVAPEAVSVPADEEQMMGVDYSKLVPMLIKEIQSLRARVAQLEGN